MMKRLSAMLFFLWCGSSLAAFDWPVAERIIVKTFGDADGNRFHKGIDLGGGRQPVKSIAEGEVVFAYEENEEFDTLPTGLGTFVVIEHGENLRSSYSHLENGSIDRRKKWISPSDVIGFTGDSGYTDGTRLHLQLTDGELGQIINPLLVLETQKDRKAPVIRSIALMRGAESLPLENGTITQGGEAQLVAQIYDPRPSVPYFWPMAPYSILVLLNGQKHFQITCDSLKLVDGEFTLNPSNGMRYGDLFLNRDVLKLGTLSLTPGRVTVEIIASDYEQNKSSTIVAFTVRNVD